MPRGFRLSHVVLRTRRIGRIDQYGDPFHRGYQLAQELKPFRRQLANEKIDAGQVTVRSGKARDKTKLDWVFPNGEDDRNSGGRRLGRDRGNGAAARDDDRDLFANKIGDECRQPVELVFGPRYSIATFSPST